MINAYTFNQVKYILYHYYELSRGRFPDPEAAGNLGMRVPCQPRPASEAACLLAAEVALRVKKCGLDGMIAEAVFMSEQGLRPENEVAREYHLGPDDLHRRINRVVAYCEGFDANPQDYDSWRKENRNRRVVR